VHLVFSQLPHCFRSLRSRTPRFRSRRPRTSRLSIESLDERCLLSADAVVQWNQAVLAATRNDKPTIGFETRDLAIVHTAIYDAVTASAVKRRLWRPRGILRDRLLRSGKLDPAELALAWG
jgi:hypothetical protein